MLVLTRKIGETIRIGENITLTIIESDGHNIKLGIEAPRTVTVHREEVWQKITEENRNAAQKQSFDMAKMAQLFKKK
jgi:carbon storage regulator